MLTPEYLQLRNWIVQEASIEDLKKFIIEHQCSDIPEELIKLRNKAKTLAAKLYNVTIRHL